MASSLGTVPASWAVRTAPSCYGGGDQDATGPGPRPLSYERGTHDAAESRSGTAGAGNGAAGDNGTFAIAGGAVASDRRPGAAAGRPTGQRSDRSTWRLLGHESDSAERFLAGGSQPISKRLRGRTGGAGVGPEFVPKRNSKTLGDRGRTVRRHGASRDWRRARHEAARARLLLRPWCSIHAGASSLLRSWFRCCRDCSNRLSRGRCRCVGSGRCYGSTPA
jgi:hypothetical protein